MNTISRIVIFIVLNSMKEEHNFLGSGVANKKERIRELIVTLARSAKGQRTWMEVCKALLHMYYSVIV